MGCCGGRKSQPQVSKEKTCTHYVEFVITDQKGNAVSGLDYVLTPADAESESEKPLDAQGIVRKEKVNEGIHKLTVKSLRQACWGEPEVTEVKEGVEVTLQATITGFDPVTAGTFKVYDAAGLASAELATVQGAVDAAGKSLEAKWTGDRNTLMKATSGQVVLAASMPKLLSVSKPTKALVKHEVTVKNQDGDVADNTKVQGRFSDSTAFEEQTQGGKVIVWAPAGKKLAWASVADKLGIQTRLKSEGGAERTFTTPERAKQ